MPPRTGLAAASATYKEDDDGYVVPLRVATVLPRVTPGRVDAAGPLTRARLDENNYLHLDEDEHIYDQLDAPPPCPVYENAGHGTCRTLRPAPAPPGTHSRLMGGWGRP